MFVVNNAAFFASHRLPLALAARAEGYDVFLTTGRAGDDQLEDGAIATLKCHSLPHYVAPIEASSMNPLRELQGLWSLIRHVRRIKPDVIHTASPKGALYGGIAARMNRVPALVIAVSGMGYLFTGKVSGVKRLARWIYAAVTRYVYAHSNKAVIVQNQDDRRHLLERGLARSSEVHLIPGSGVDMKLFEQMDPSSQPHTVVLPSRLLGDKGVREFVQAAGILKTRGCAWRFVLVGTAGYRNPSAIPDEELRSWVDAGIVEWWGHRDDMPSVYAEAGIVCLPSYREGMPKVLLEAAAAGRPVLTTDVPGCREAIIPGETGDLVPARDPQALAIALEMLIKDPGRRLSYGRAGRTLADTQFNLEIVLARVLSIYEELSSRAEG